MIDERRKNGVKKVDSHGQTVIDLALQDEEYGCRAPVQELVDQIKTFLFGGHDTSASVVAWTYYYLSICPDVHAKMKSEHDSIFGPFTDTASLAEQINQNPKLLAKLEYTLAVLKEVLRLRPPADGARQGPPGYIIRTDSGYEFDASDTMIATQHLGLHTKESAWGPTAQEFDPDRFMDAKRVPAAYMPFSTRPRDCIGRNLAYIEVWKALESTLTTRGNLCWPFQFEDLTSTV